MEIPLLYYPGYRAEADGTECLVAQGDNHVIRLYRIREGTDIPVRVWFEPPMAWRIAEGISVLGFALLAAALAVMSKRRGA